MLSDNDIVGLFRARVRFAEAGVALYQGLVLTTEPSIEREEYQDELDQYRAQADVLMMNVPELAAANKGRGMEGSAACDETRRRAEMTHHDRVEETVERTNIRRERKIQSPDLRARAKFRGVGGKGAER